MGDRRLSRPDGQKRPPVALARFVLNLKTASPKYRGSPCRVETA
jgi:hypothetical protein